MKEGKELEALLSLTVQRKNELRSKGLQYVREVCSWKKRMEEWTDLLCKKEFFNENPLVSVKYGTMEKNVDITQWVVDEDSLQIVVPAGDEERAMLFSDPIFGVKKSVFICNTNYPEKRVVFSSEQEVNVNFYDLNKYYFSADI